jgi:hypothetical protein
MLMPNALSVTNATPAPPNPQLQQQSSGNALAPGPAPQAMGTAPGDAPGQQSAAPPPPPPSHQQTVAALRHFTEIERELTQILKNPDLGKANLRSEIIDGATGLVSRGILSASDAVQQLGTVPDVLFQQKQWVQKHFTQTVQAQTSILAQHAQGFAGQQVPTDPSDPDNHMNVISSLLSQYKGASPQ